MYEFGRTAYLMRHLPTFIHKSLGEWAKAWINLWMRSSRPNGPVQIRGETGQENGAEEYPVGEEVVVAVVDDLHKDVVDHLREIPDKTYLEW